MTTRLAPGALIGTLCGLLIGTLLTFAATLQIGHLPVPVALLTIHGLPALFGALLGISWELEA